MTQIVVYIANTYGWDSTGGLGEDSNHNELLFVFIFLLFFLLCKEVTCQNIILISYAGY